MFSLYVLVYSLAMKYVAILVIIIMFVRIDLLLQMFDNVTDNLEKSPQEVSSEEVKSKRETIPLAEDKTFKQTPKSSFLALMNDFHVNPSADVRLQALGVLKQNPNIFGTKLDKEFEQALYGWRDLLNNNEPELVNFLLDFQNFMLGQNLEAVKKFFALWMEINMEHFIAAYSRTKDSTCTIATILGDPIPEEERLNEYYDREDALRALLTKEKLDPAHKALTANCILQLTLMIDKIKPVAVTQPSEEENNNSAAPQTSSDIQATPPSGTTP